MTDKLKNRLKLGVVIALALLLGGLGVAKASEGNFLDNVAKWTGKFYADKLPAPEVSQPVEDQSLGAVTGPNFPNPNCTNNDCTLVVEGSFKTGTSTFVSIIPPREIQKPTSTGAGSEVVVRTDDGGQAWTAASTTVTLTRLNITTGATTSFKLACGAYSNSVGALPLTRTNVSTTPVLAGDSIATSSVGLIENNLTSAQGAMYDVGTVNKITVDSANPYFVCLAVGVNDKAFTNGDESFAGKYAVQFRWTK